MSKNYVKVTPMARKGKPIGFYLHDERNRPIPIGTKLVYEASTTLDQEFIRRKMMVTVTGDFPYCFTCDSGKFKLSVNKASIYCGNERLYIYDSSER